MENTSKNAKPLGRKSYGSIGHLPASRMGPSDHALHPGQAAIATDRLRDKHDFVVVQEKLDGSNVGVARLADGSIVALGRAGYLAESSPYEQHKLFANWVREDTGRFDFLEPGERLCGEWLAQAHGTRYELAHEPFVAFDLMTEGKRTPYLKFVERIAARFTVPALLSIGGPTSVERALSLLGPNGFHGAVDPVEGAVWRVERKGIVDFLCKYVRPDKLDGRYLPEISEANECVWNWHPINKPTKGLTHV